MTLQDYYNTGDDAFAEINSSVWYAQTFTANQTYTISSVKLRLSRFATPPDNVIVSIRAVNGDGHPTGSDLTSGSIAGSGITENAAGEWYEITLTSYELTSGTKYAIVARTDTNNARWRIDNSSPTYTNGNGEYSGNAGSTWFTYTFDCMFETHSEAVYADLVGTGGGIGDGSGILTKTLMANLVGTSGGVGGGSAVLLVSGFPSEGAGVSRAYKRIVAAGNDRIYFEDI